MHGLWSGGWWWLVVGVLCGASVASRGAGVPPWPAGLQYGGGPWQPKQVEKYQDAQLIPMLLQYFKMFGITELVRLSKDGAPAQVWSGTDAAGKGLSALSRPEQRGLLTALQNRPMGLEADVLVAQPGGAVPVTVYWDAKERLAVRSGAPLAAAAAVDGAAIRAK